MNMTPIESRLCELRLTERLLRESEAVVDRRRTAKWELVKELKAMGHDFKATTEGMDIVLSSSPSMNWN